MFKQKIIQAKQTHFLFFTAEFVSCPLYEDTSILFQPADLLTLTTAYANAATSFISTKAGAMI